ncbi:3-oxoacyl-ACP reductase FabG [Peribacillus cavernae]|uniref:3-oxoacyl-ACP reductase FabG n=1 Tax=Peribacillus cavernae TaxID=1674310 RepID=A0A3S0VLH6_9BACI|nr:3-oxoacyl-ACP reductase family protein [Peribacillus cavernae]MDQ0217715.1 3-oxoacyl-[acyl-carrier protein] reductase [Peribacillus cavernae]RUQ28181.1 3-oxoacyl-ACP reductase FabG [Peribacillus cavernae]
MKLKGKAAIITGAGQGIGLGIARAYAEEGANLSLNIYGKNPEEVDSIITELKNYNVDVIVSEEDITKESTVKEMVDKTIERYGRIDILVNNAGIITESLVHDMPVEMWDQMIDIDLKSVFLMTKYAVPHMIEQKSGRIISTSSQLGQKGAVKMSHYAAAKAGVIGFTKSIALELGQYGITANCIAPGPTDTELFAGLSESFRTSKKAELVIPRFARVDEVAPTAVFLASDPEGNVYTGQTLGPNSGDVML